jgi:hypothetical protein
LPRCSGFAPPTRIWSVANAIAVTISSLRDSSNDLVVGLRRGGEGHGLDAGALRDLIHVAVFAFARADSSGPLSSSALYVPTSIPAIFFSWWTARSFRTVSRIQYGP